MLSTGVVKSERGQPGRISILDDYSTSSLTASTTSHSTMTTGSHRRSMRSMLAPATPLRSSSFELNKMDLWQSPTFESPAAFDNFDFDLPLRWYKRVWCFLLGLAGVLDILAYEEPSLRNYHDERCLPRPAEDVVISFVETPMMVMMMNDVRDAVPWYCSRWATFLDRLREYNVVIAFAFSLLWFLNSQSKAREEYYYKFSVMEDRMQLLSSGTCETAKHNNKKFSARNAYYRAFLSRTLLLPVGFYVISFHLIRGLMSGKWLYHELLIKPTNETETAFLTIQDPMEYVTIEIWESHAKMSTVIALLIYMKYHILLASQLWRAEFLDSVIPWLRRKLIFNAVSNPMNFVRQLNRVLKYVRWIRYMLPLIGQCNKLKENIALTLRKRRQYHQAKRRQANKRALSRRHSVAIRANDAAIIVQRAWRSHQNDVYHKVAVLFLKDRKLASALKIQLAYRRMSLKARISNSRKFREVFQLEELKRVHSKQLNDDDRRRLYQLQDEFVNEAKKTINKRLLMRPNTRFSFVWNSLFVFCVLVEISQVALRPWLTLPKSQQKTEDGKYKSMRMFVAESIIPRPVAETEACKDLFKKPSPFQRLFYRSYHVEQPSRQEVVAAFIDEITDPEYDLDFGLNVVHHNNNTKQTVKKFPWRCSEPILSWREGYRDAIALTFHPDPVAEWPACQPPEPSTFRKYLLPFRKKEIHPLPWYCHSPYSTVHDAYNATWNFVIDQIQVVISIICFFDVFVKFLTGAIDPITGELQPKPWFKRWILPGLLLQLLVNPSIGSFSEWFFACVDWVMVIGPIRVLRWCIAVLVPLFYLLRNLLFTALQDEELQSDQARYGMMLWECSH